MLDDSRVLTYLALADGRGHLMRAHLVSELLDDRAVNVLTTSSSGARFFRELNPKRAVSVLPGGFHIPMQRADLDERAVQVETARYLSRPSGLMRDVRAIKALVPPSGVLVVDSFHPAALFVGLTHARDTVLVHAEHVRRTALARTKAPFDRLLQRALERMPVVEASLAPTHAEQLYPLTAAPRPVARTRPAVVVYLNPNLCRAVDACALTAGLRAEGLDVVGIGPREAGLVSSDPNLVDHIASARAVIAAPGIATSAQALLLRRPLVALLGAQPEQRANFAQLIELGAQASAVELDRTDVTREIVRATLDLSQSSSRPDLEALNENRARWRARITQEIHERNRPCSRDPQPSKRTSTRRSRRRRAA